MAALAAALAVGVLPGTARAEVRYWVTEVDVAEAAVNSVTRGISDTGYVNGNYWRSDGTGTGFLYHNGTFTSLPSGIPDWGGIGDSGETLLGDTLLYAAGTVTDLAALGMAYASMVNGDGWVVGTTNGHPVIFHNGAVTQLTAIDGTGDFISANGYVAGYLTAGYTYLYANGVVTTLPFYEFWVREDRRHAVVNTSGVVVGYYLGALGERRVGLWDGSLQDLGEFEPRVINARGDVAGNLWVSLPWGGSGPR